MTATDWWTDLYAPRHADTASAGGPPAPPRIPPPGQTINLDAPQPADEAAEDKPPTRHPRRRKHRRPDYQRIAELERDLGIADEDTVQPEPDSPDTWSDIPERDAPPDQRAVLAGAARVHQAVAAVPGRLRWLTYNGTAAGAGWCCHLVQPVRTFIAGCGHQTGDQTAAVILGAGICALIGWRWDARTRGWWGPLPWACRIPLASAVLALALYAPGTGH